MARKIEKTVYTFQELIDLANDPDSDISERAVGKAREWLQQGQCDFPDWYEHVIDMWKQALDQVGFENAEIQFSGFGSQGDGASFTADVDLYKLVHFLSTAIEPKESIDSDGHGGELFLPWVVYQLNGVRTNPRYTVLSKIGEYIDMDIVGRITLRPHEQSCKVRGDLRDSGHYEDPKPGEWLGTWISKTPKLRKLFDSFLEDCEDLRCWLSQCIYSSLEKEYEWLMSDEQLLEMAEANEYTFDKDGYREG